MAESAYDYAAAIRRILTGVLSYGSENIVWLPIIRWVPRNDLPVFANEYG